MNEKNSLYLFDTFTGFRKEDVDVENKLFDKGITEDMLTYYSTKQILDVVHGRDEKRNIDIITVEGSVPESFEPYRGETFRFVSVDMDLYQPTAGLLTKIWDCMVPGGIMLFHDYGCSLFPGVAKAVDEFFIPKGITPIPLPDWTVSAIVIKSFH